MSLNGWAEGFSMQQLELDAAFASIEMWNGDWLAWARSYAQSYASLHGSVSSDDVRVACDQIGYQPDSPHAWGALFKAKGWVFLARTRSVYGSNNGRYIGVWRWEI